MPAIPECVTDPRVRRTREAVLDAVLVELAEAGYGGFSVESVAARAGVGKATMYRHWSGRTDLIVDALERLDVPPAELEATGSARDQVEQLLTYWTRVMTDPSFGARVPALIEAAERDATVRDFYHRYLARRRQPLCDAVARGMAEGEFSEIADAELAVQALVGALLYRRVMTATPLAAQDVPKLMTTVLGPR